MAKSITNKITTERKLAINGFLDIDSLDKGMILVDVETAKGERVLVKI